MPAPDTYHEEETPVNLPVPFIIIKYEISIHQERRISFLVSTKDR